MDVSETLITYLCMTCPRMKEICKKYPPTWAEAYRCKWDEADALGRKIAEHNELLHKE